VADHPTPAQQLNRATAECAAQIRKSRASCEDSAEHIKASREAIARSLEVLNRTAMRVRD
jgi:hypothetical protein